MPRFASISAVCRKGRSTRSPHTFCRAADSVGHLSLGVCIAQVTSPPHDGGSALHDGRLHQCSSLQWDPLLLQGKDDGEGRARRGACESSVSASMCFPLRRPLLTTARGPYVSSVCGVFFTARRRASLHSGGLHQGCSEGWNLPLLQGKGRSSTGAWKQCFGMHVFPLAQPLVLILKCLRCVCVLSLRVFHSMGEGRAVPWRAAPRAHRAEEPSAEG